MIPRHFKQLTYDHKIDISNSYLKMLKFNKMRLKIRKVKNKQNQFKQQKIKLIKIYLKSLMSRELDYMGNISYLMVMSILNYLRTPIKIYLQEWNDLVSTMLEAEDQPDQIMQFNLIRNRRVKGRQINGSVELFLIKSNNQEAENMKQKMIDCLDEIEKTELDITNLEENNENINPQNAIEGGGQQHYNFNKHAGGIRNKKFLAGELKLKINRLTEEYEQLNKLFRKAQKLQQ
eukprot:403358135